MSGSEENILLSVVCWTPSQIPITTIWGIYIEMNMMIPDGRQRAGKAAGIKNAYIFTKERTT